MYNTWFRFSKIESKKERSSLHSQVHWASSRIAFRFSKYVLEVVFSCFCLLLVELLFIRAVCSLREKNNCTSAVQCYGSERDFNLNKKKGNQSFFRQQATERDRGGGGCRHQP